MRLELEHEQSSVRELQAQVSDGRRREEKLKAATEVVAAKIRNRARAGSGTVSFPVMGLIFSSNFLSFLGTSR